MDNYHSQPCSGYLVWDYERGEVICSSTGEVVDRIYDYGPTIMKPETRERLELELRSKPKRNHLELRYSRDYRVYLEAEKRVRGKPWLVVDYDKLLKTRRFVKTISSHNTIRALDNIRRLGLERDLKKVMELIETVEPSALSRTERARNALAYIVMSFLDKHRPPDPLETVEIFQISNTTYKRLERVAKRIYYKLVQKTIQKPIIVR